MKKKFVGIIVFLTICISAPAFAAEVYVSSTGNDTTGNGTSSNPYATITKALPLISGGDTIYCQGSITDSFTIPASVAGSAGAPTTITTAPSQTCSIDGGGALNNAVITIATNANYITISNLSLTNARLYGILLDWDSSASNLTISGNTIYGMTNGNINIYLNHAANLIVSNNTIYGDGSDAYGMWISYAANSVIEKNKVYGFTTTGIALDHDSDNSVIKNNWVYDIHGGSGLDLAGIHVLNTDNVGVYNNDVVCEGATNSIPGIKMSADVETTTNIEIKNNILDSCYYGIQIDSNCTSGFASDYNNFYNLGFVGKYGDIAEDISSWRTASGQDANSQTSDPSLVSTTSGSEDLHLQEESSMIDNGADIAGVTDDFEGQSRPYNITDIGADELPSVGEPTSLSSSSVTATSATLSWTAPAGTITTHTLQYSTSADFSSAVDVSGLTSAGHDLSGLSAETTYYWRVKAIFVDGFGTYESEYSQSANFTTLTSLTAPSAPTNLAVTSRDTESISLSWDVPTGTIAGYKVYYSTDENFSDNLYMDVTANTAEFTDLTSNTLYYFKVKATNSTGDSSYSEVASARTLPAQVENVTAPKKFRKTHQVKIKWASAGEGLTYQVKLMNKKGKKIKIYTATGLKKIIKKLKAGKIYKVKVRAKFDADNIGAWSKAMRFKTIHTTSFQNLSIFFPDLV